MNTRVGTTSATRIDGLANVWAVIEARNGFPAVIVVTGATAADDTHGLARGLAAVAEGTGRRTGLLALASSPNGASDVARYTELSIAGRPATPKTLDDAFVVWRAAHDVIVVAAGLLGSEALGLYVVPKATSVVIAVCDQRRIDPADRKLVDLLAGLQAVVFGVVMTTPIPKLLGDPGARDRARFAAVASV